MSTQANTMPESPLESQVVAPSPISPAQRFYWSLRRELWENRALYVVPLATAAVFLFGFLINLLILRRRLPGLFNSAEKLHSGLATPYEAVATLIMGFTFVVGVFYTLDALYGERRDRSILFWKSLPVSDLTVVLSKFTVPLVVLPVLAFVITIATQVIMLLLSTVALAGSGLSVRTLWANSPAFSFSTGLLYHILTVHGLWYAPLYGWMLLVSAWARRAPIIWAFLPPAVICGVEKIAFNTTYVLNELERRVIGPDPAMIMSRNPTLTDAISAMTPWQFFTEPGLWIGLAIAAVFLAAAVRMRRYRGPI